jgi:hypothetical protein
MTMIIKLLTGLFNALNKSHSELFGHERAMTTAMTRSEILERNVSKERLGETNDKC